MLRYALIFLVLAMVAALFGFGTFSTDSHGVAHVLAMLFVVLAVLGLSVGLLRGR